MLIVGVQDYSSGQQKKVDVWRLKCRRPIKMPYLMGAKCDSYAGACGLLARLYFDGDVAKTLGAIRP